MDGRVGIGVCRVVRTKGLVTAPFALWGTGWLLSNSLSVSDSEKSVGRGAIIPLRHSSVIHSFTGKTHGHSVLKTKNKIKQAFLGAKEA